MAKRCLATLLILLFVASFQCDQSRTQFSSSTIINSVAQDPRTGRLYLGAVNHIYQLDSNLKEESVAVTGPKKDSPNCTPPITALCTEAKEMDNINKLLLVNPANGSLVVCGSIYRGICSLVNLSNVEQILYFSDSKGEKSYVASRSNVSVVGVISSINRNNKNLSVFLVGQGYASSESLKLVSTRLLEQHGDFDIFENVVESSIVQVGPSKMPYLHDFRYSFKENNHIYFLFSRMLGNADTHNFTFIARLCENDLNYFSYTELQLNCSIDGKNIFHKVQAAYLANPGRALLKNLSSGVELREDEKVLFAVFRNDGGLNSALCAYPLSSINRGIEEVIKSCYNGENTKAVSPYTSPKAEKLCTQRFSTDVSVYLILSFS